MFVRNVRVSIDLKNRREIENCIDLVIGKIRVRRLMIWGGTNRRSLGSRSIRFLLRMRRISKGDISRVEKLARRRFLYTRYEYSWKILSIFNILWTIKTTHAGISFIIRSLLASIFKISEFIVNFSLNPAIPKNQTYPIILHYG